METIKVTVRISTPLLHRARGVTGEGITGTIRRGLKLVVATNAPEKLRQLRGKVRPIEDLREQLKERD
jgi:hypothetical protein